MFADGGGNVNVVERCYHNNKEQAGVVQSYKRILPLDDVLLGINPLDQGEPTRITRNNTNNSENPPALAILSEYESVFGYLMSKRWASTTFCWLTSLVAGSFQMGGGF